MSIPVKYLITLCLSVVSYLAITDLLADKNYASISSHQAHDNNVQIQNTDTQHYLQMSPIVHDEISVSVKTNKVHAPPILDPKAPTDINMSTHNAYFGDNVTSLLDTISYLQTHQASPALIGSHIDQLKYALLAQPESIYTLTENLDILDYDNPTYKTILGLVKGLPNHQSESALTKLAEQYAMLPDQASHQKLLSFVSGSQSDRHSPLLSDALLYIANTDTSSLSVRLSALEELNAEQLNFAEKQEISAALIDAVKQDTLKENTHLISTLLRYSDQSQRQFLAKEILTQYPHSAYRDTILDALNDGTVMLSPELSSSLNQ